MVCDKGAAPVSFQPVSCLNVNVGGVMMANTNDKEPVVHIPPFGACSLTGGAPCAMVPIMWSDTSPVRVRGAETLEFQSCLQCGVGGKISFLTSGQVPLPPGELDALMEEHGEAEEDESGWGWWDTAELIPVIGNVIGMAREAKKGNWGMVAFNAAFLMLDVATLGVASLVTAPAKGVIKAGIKYATKTAIKAGAKVAAAKTLAKGGAAALGKAVSKKVASIVGEKGIVCVVACFAKGTLVSVEDGQQPIEDIRVGQKVWAQDETTGAVQLKRVVRVSTKEAPITVDVTVGEEIIRTTAEHPFYTRSGWKNAGALTEEDEVLTRGGFWHRVRAAQNNFAPQVVYNLEVEDLSNYFVGAWEWLVHNTKICLMELAQAGVKYAKDIINGQRFDKVMAEVYDYTQIVMKNGKRVDAIVPGREVISHKFTQLADIQLDTAKGYISELVTKYSDEMTNSKKILDGLGEQVSTKKLRNILEVPPQLKAIPQEILDYADQEDVIIREIS